MMIDTNLQYDGWHVGRSIDYLLKNSNPKSTKSCAGYVRRALIAGGIQAYGNPVAAQDYHFQNYLDKIGFVKVTELEDKISQENYRPLPGDIAVMQAPTGNIGHICMWTGENWASDFIQARMRPYSGKGNNPETCYIYRWKN